MAKNSGSSLFVSSTHLLLLSNIRFRCGSVMFMFDPNELIPLVLKNVWAFAFGFRGSSFFSNGIDEGGLTILKLEIIYY